MIGNTAPQSHSRYVAQPAFCDPYGRERSSWRSVRSVRIARSCSPIDRGPQMSKPISPLRQRMIDDMTMRNLSPSSQETYIRAVAQFSAFHRRSPDKLGVEHLREYQLHLVSRSHGQFNLREDGRTEVLVRHNIETARHRETNSNASPVEQPAYSSGTRGG